MASDASATHLLTNVFYNKLNCQVDFIHDRGFAYYNSL